jgi:hypothetical protein
MHIAKSNPETSDQIWDMIRKKVEAGKMKERYKKWAELTEKIV